MKKTLCLILLIFIIYSPNVLAHERLDDGWHIVVKNTESERGKSWYAQAKEWAYYENGKEILRYSSLLGSHRGWGDAPENSLASFQMTKDKGYYAFETDVRFTKDNVAVLLHDATINGVARNNDLSTITETTYVKDLTYNELKNNYVFNIERINHGKTTVLPDYNTNRITTFEEMLDFVKANKMYVNIELKEGTKEQIESLVKMTQKKGMHNYVRWLSYYTDLLKIVKDYDEDENLSVTTSSTCDDVHNLYCGQDVEYYNNKLKTDTNMLWLPKYNHVYNPPSISCAINLPIDYNKYLPDKDKKTPIEKAKLELTENNIVIETGKEVSLTYQYNGDGIVKCVNNNNDQLTCEVDSNNHKIILKSINSNNTNASISLYATQGILYSATDDVNLQVSIKDKENIISNQVNNIEIEGYNINFNNTTYQYKIKTNSENELKINVKLNSENLRYEIEGNQNLKNGSIIKVKIFQENDNVLTYNIVIEADACYKHKSSGKLIWGKYENNSSYELINNINEANCKEAIHNVPKTDLNISFVIYLFITIMLCTGIWLIVYSNNIVKEK